MRVLVVAVVMAGCGDNLAAPPDAEAIDRIADVHALVPCGATWTLPIANPQCEAACVPRPALPGLTCDATHPIGAYTTCGATFVAHAVGGDFTGCCALFGTPEIPTKLIFLTCGP